MSEIVSLVYQPTPSIQEPPYHYSRVPVTSFNLIAGHGIEGDLKAGHHPDRHLNIMNAEMVENLRTEGYKTAPGELGEQIILNGLDLVSFPVGTQIQLGDSAIIEITKERTGCDWFQQIQGFPKANTIHRLGIMATVVTGGQVKVGDPVQVLIPELA